MLVTDLAQLESPWLLVFDNAVAETDIAPYVPDGGGMVLVTSRNRSFDRLGHVTEVGVLTPAVVEAFLRDRVRKNNPNSADEPAVVTVAARLGGLPLALEQAGAWVAASKTNTFARYLRLLDDASKNPFPDDTIPLDYERTTWDTWQVSIDAATAKAPLATKILAALSWIAPEGLSLAWLTAAANDEYVIGHPSGADDAAADESPNDDDTEAVLEAVAALNQFSLVATDGHTIDIHRVVQAATRRQAAHDSGRFAVRMLRHQSPGSAWEVENWARYQLLTRVVRAVGRVDRPSAVDALLATRGRESAEHPGGGGSRSSGVRDPGGEGGDLGPPGDAVAGSGGGDGAGGGGVGGSDCV
jgi:hypothetical protein